jgi:hypothetical protein
MIEQLSELCSKSRCRKVYKNHHDGRHYEPGKTVTYLHLAFVRAHHYKAKSLVPVNKLTAMKLLFA